MKKHTIELNDDLSSIYEDIAKINSKTTEEAMQIILRRVIETMLKEKPADKSSENFSYMYHEKDKPTQYL